MRKNNTGEVSGIVLRRADGDLYVCLNKKYTSRLKKDEYKIINKSTGMLFVGDAVRGEVMSLAAKREKCFFAYTNKTPRVDINKFHRLIDLTVINWVNREGYIYGKAIKEVTLDDLRRKDRHIEYVLCRHLCVWYSMKYLGDQMSDEMLGEQYNMNRSSLWHIKHKIPNNTDKQVEGIMKDIDYELKTIYNNIKKTD